MATFKELSTDVNGRGFGEPTSRGSVAPRAVGLTLASIALGSYFYTIVSAVTFILAESTNKAAYSASSKPLLLAALHDYRSWLPAVEADLGLTCLGAVLTVLTFALIGLGQRTSNDSQVLRLLRTNDNLQTMASLLSTGIVVLAIMVIVGTIVGEAEVGPSSPLSDRIGSASGTIALTVIVSGAAVLLVSLVTAGVGRDDRVVADDRRVRDSERERMQLMVVRLSKDEHARPVVGWKLVKPAGISLLATLFLGLSVQILLAHFDEFPLSLRTIRWIAVTTSGLYVFGMAAAGLLVVLFVGRVTRAVWVVAILVGSWLSGLLLAVVAGWPSQVFTVGGAVFFWFALPLLVPSATALGPIVFGRTSRLAALVLYYWTDREGRRFLREEAARSSSVAGDDDPADALGSGRVAKRASRLFVVVAVGARFAAAMRRGNRDTPMRKTE